MPAASSERLRQAAMADAGEKEGPVRPSSNVVRNALRMIQRHDVGWRIPIQEYDYRKLDGDFLKTHYLKPSDILEFFIPRHPILLCGADDTLKMQTLCEAFWGAYKKHHPSHEVFTHHSHRLRYVLPVALHGDEGKGKRRSNTTVAAMEAVMGCMQPAFPTCHCASCELNLQQFGPLGDAAHLVAKGMRTNMKGHSFLQHFPLFIIQGTLGADVKPLLYCLLDIIAVNLANLFHTGVSFNDSTWFAAVVGAKGDLKYHTKQARLTRGFERQGRVRDLECCHWCLAGGPNYPAEDVATDHPCWEPTMWSIRPWSLTEKPCFDIVPYDCSAPERLYQHDVFHTLRLGVYRDFVGSVVFLYIEWGFFGGGAVPMKLQRAHAHFRLWCLAVSKSPSLRSFTKSLFQYTNRKSFPWINAKGSDVMLCVKWLVTATCGFMAECADPQKLHVLKTIFDAATVAVDFFTRMNSHGLWMNTTCAAALYELGHSFVIAYTWLAGFAFRSSLCLFSIKPKIHFFRHLLLMLLVQVEQNSQVILSPQAWDCSQNEDFIGRMSNLAIKTDSRVSTRRVLHLWMIKASILYKRHFPGKGCKR